MDRCFGWIRRTLRKSSIFKKTFAGLLLLSLAMVLFWGGWVNRTAGQNQRRQLAAASLTRLSQTGESMKLTIDFLGQTMDQILWSDDVIKALVSPNRVEQSQEYRIIRQLNSSEKGSALVKDAALYSPLVQRVYSSELTGSVDEYENREFLQVHLRERQESGKRSEAMTVTSVCAEAGRLFLFQDLEIPNWIGTLIYEIDLDELAKSLGIRGNGEVPDILVYGENGERIFGDAMSYADTDVDWENGELFITRGDPGEKKSGFFRYDDEMGWVYLIKISGLGTALGPGDILPVYLIFSVVFLVLSAGFAFYISESIYRPIGRLMKVASQSQVTRNSLNDSEIDYLEGVYSDAIGQQSQFHGVIADIAPDIMDSMLKNLMVGKTLMEERVGEILEGVGNPIPLHGRYLVLVCRMIEPEGRAVSDAELNLHLVSIRKCLEGAASPLCRMYDIHTEKLIVAVVMAFAQESPAIAVKKEYARIAQILEQLGKQTTLKFQIERGSIYQNLLDIRYAYREALERLSYQQYIETSEEKGEEETSEETGKVVNSRYFKERVRAVAKAAAGGEREEAKALVGRFLDDLERETGDSGEIQSIMEMFLDELTEKVVALPLNERDQKLLEEAQKNTRFSASGDMESMKKQAIEYSRMAVRLLHEYSRKNSYRYVEQVREYIEEHYADSNLSLNEICEKIGISASYLSELYNEVRGEKFSVSLATFRVEKAKQLLKTTKVTIREIGFCCGFNSVQNFIRVFKKYTGRTPGQFREESQKPSVNNFLDQ